MSRDHERGDMSTVPNLTPAIEGWFTLDEASPSLIGSRCKVCRTYVFPPATIACPNPDCDTISSKEDSSNTDSSDTGSFDSVELSQRGRIWSYTDARYQPPPPYVATDPFEPFCLAAVELAEERLVVLGQVVSGFTVDDLRVGMEVELVLAPLHDGGAQSADMENVVIWKWRPVEDTQPLEDTERGAAR
jgi:uncharacterized OB-fold protein